jgi:hypothetical protein
VAGCFVKVTFKSNMRQEYQTSLGFLLHILEVVGSNIDTQTGCLEVSFWFFLSNQENGNVGF